MKIEDNSFATSKFTSVLFEVKKNLQGKFILIRTENTQCLCCRVVFLYNCKIFDRIRAGAGTLNKSRHFIITGCLINKQSVMSQKNTFQNRGAIMCQGAGS